MLLFVALQAVIKADPASEMTTHARLYLVISAIPFTKVIIDSCPPHVPVNSKTVAVHSIN